MAALGPSLPPPAVAASDAESAEAEFKRHRREAPSVPLVMTRRGDAAAAAGSAAAAVTRPLCAWNSPDDVAPSAASHKAYIGIT